MTRHLLTLAAIAIPAGGAALVLLVPRRLAGQLAVACALLTSGTGLVLAAICLHEPSSTSRWLVLDPAGGLLLAVSSAVGLATVLVSPSYLAAAPPQGERRTNVYYALVLLFWAVLVAIAVSANVGVAWLLVEASTAPSALLVGFTGKARALEAGWKYLVLTSLGLGVALLGIVILAGGVPGGLGRLSWSALPHVSSPHATVLAAYLLLLAGLAGKIGWAPVHNWLPDAHSEAPAPVSGLLSAALLPTVVLIAWRSEQGLSPVLGHGTAGSALVAFGLASVAVAVPFLWRPLAWKRLLAYSSLEHMGVLALGIGFGTRLALAGVVVHVTGHAVAKALGFYAATPLLGHEPRAGSHGVTGIGRTEPALGAAMGLSLGTLAGLPPSPLFFSEVLIVAGGFEAGRPWEAGVAALILGLGFVGLMHSLLEVTVGKTNLRAGRAPGLRTLSLVAAGAGALLAALTGAALWLPGSHLVRVLVRGLG